MKILHLSDFHFRSERKAQVKQKTIVKNILNSLEKTDDIDIIIFSGDLVNKGDKFEDFELADNMLLEQIAKKLKVSKEYIFLCPGNHDVNRNEKLESIIDYIDKIKNNNDLNAFEKQKPKDFELSCLPFNNYIKYLNKYINTSLGDYIETLFTVQKRKLKNDFEIGVVSINSAWRAVGINDENNLVFPSQKIEDAISYIDSCDYKIFVQHHPLSDFKNFNSSELEDVLHNHFDLMLTGHVHKSKDSIHLTSGAGMISMGAPAALSFDSNSEIGYGIVEFDFEESEFQITKYLFDRRNNTIYSVPKPKMEIPSDEEKKELNKFRKKLRKKYQIELNEAKNLFVSQDGYIDSRSFAEMCTKPILKFESPNEVDRNEKIIESTLVDWENLNSPEHDYLILGKDKCGKTVLLKKILLDLLLYYPSYKTVPYYIDCKEYNSVGKELDIINEFYRYFEFNKTIVNRILESEKIVFLLDNYQFKNNQFLLEIRKFVEKNPNIKIIACSDETMVSAIEEAKIDGRTFIKLYFHRLRKKHIKELSNKTYNLPLDKQNEIVEKIDSIFTRLSIPFNFWTVSLFLWIFKKDLNSNIQNDVELINLYIEKLLEKERLTIERSSFGYDKYKRYLAHLAHHLLTKRIEFGHSVDYSDLLTFTLNYLSHNPRYNVEARDIIKYVEDRGILIKKNRDVYSFRLNGVFEYFIAQYMTIHKDFVNDIINDEEFYLSFANEFELYAGFNRDDKKFLDDIYKKTKKIFNPVNVKYNEKDMSLDIRLKSKLAHLTELKTIVDKITSKLKDGLTIDEQDEIEEQMLIESGLNNDNASDVKPKQIQVIDNSIEALEKSLSILGRVYKNIDEVNDENLVYEIFDYVIDSACHWGFKIIDNYSSKELKDLLAGANEKEAQELLRLITNLIPTLVQVRLNDFLGHRNIEKIILNRIDTLKINSKQNQYKLFLLHYLLCDIDLNQYKTKLFELLKLLQMPILKYSSLIKLNYYLGFKTNEDKKSIQFFQNLLQQQQLSFDRDTNLGSLHKDFSEKNKVKNYNVKD